MVEQDIVVLYPSPGRGHLFAAIELGQLIVKHKPSLSITIIVSALPNESISADPYITAVSAATPSITFIHLPAVTLPPITAPTHEHIFLTSFAELPEANNHNLRETLLNISKSFNIKALIIDFFCTAAVKVSSSLNIPTYYFITSGASALCVFLYFSTIHNNTESSFKDHHVILDVPGIPLISSKYLPVVVHDRSQKIYQYFVDSSIQMSKSAGIIINTFESMEHKAVKAMVEGECTPDEPTAPPIYCVGPIVTSKESKDKHECLNWLDLQPSRSVLFLSFGSMGVFSTTQLKEIATGLERSCVRFLWVVRNPPADNKTIINEPKLESLLPEGFIERTKERGFVVKLWAPQVEVLNHGSVGGFVTHCGWNSILEAVCAGVPMLAWPLYAEQRLNKVVVVEEMRAALALAMSEEGFVSAIELEQRVNELMKSEKGEEVRERVMALKKQAVEALSDGGSSLVAMAKLVDSLCKRN